MKRASTNGCNIKKNPPQSPFGVSQARYLLKGEVIGMPLIECYHETSELHENKRKNFVFFRVVRG